MHRAVWQDGREVAVKVQYPGAGDALIADLNQLSRLAGMFRVIQPGLDVKPLVAELRDRITEELDYELEAASQRAFATAYADDAEILVPRVVACSPRVLVTEWIDGTPLAAGHRVRHARGARPGRAPAGDAALLRADAGRAAARRPAPGQLPAAARRPARRDRLRRGGPAARRAPRADRPARPGWPSRPGRRGARRPARRRASSSATPTSTPQAVLDFLRSDAGADRGGRVPVHPGLAAGRGGPAGQPAEPRLPAGPQLNLPPSYLLIHRVTLGSIGVLCQLEARAPYRGVVERWLPGFAEPAAVAD